MEDETRLFKRTHTLLPVLRENTLEQRWCLAFKVPEGAKQAAAGESAPLVLAICGPQEPKTIKQTPWGPPVRMANPVPSDLTTRKLQTQIALTVSLANLSKPQNETDMNVGRTSGG